MNIDFREIREQELSEVKKIYDWYIVNSTATFHTEPVTTAELKEFIYFGHPLYKSYFILADGKIVGYCYLTYYKKRQAYNRTAEITLYLMQEYCNKGIGKTAVQYLEAKARVCGIKNLIGIITGENAQSIALFEKSGFIKCAHFKNVGEKFNKILDVVAYQKEIQ